MNKEANAMSNNKGIKKILAVALLSTMGLIACGGEIKATPTNHKDPVISFTESNGEIYNNLMSIIEDAYRDSSLGSAVLDKVLYQYSVAVFGRYNEVSKPTNLQGDLTLRQIAAELKAGKHENADKFIEEHKAYWSTDNDGNRLTDADAKEREYERVTAKWNTIEKRISRAFYDAISGGAYSNSRKYFDESKYLAELRSKLEKVKDPYSTKTTQTTENDKLALTADVDEERVFDNYGTETDKKIYLHRENYQDSRSHDIDTIEFNEGDDKVTITYVEDSIIPTIYRSLLVEQYLLDESYNTLGRSYARKVNVITISENSNNDKSANYLMKYLVRDVISKGLYTEDTFNDFSKLYKGILTDTLSDNTTTVGSKLASIETAYPGAFPPSTIGAYRVGTDYGDMMAKYEKITSDILTTDSSIESDFTGSYTYPKEIGKEIKENEIRTNDYTTDGWYIKNGGLSELPDSIKSRLFNIGVANVLDGKKEDLDALERYSTTTGYVKEQPEKEGKLVARINGKFFLKVDKKQTGADIKDDILFYENGKYYIVQIDEAISGSKLAKVDTNEVYSIKEKEEIINDVARVIANNDTYQSASTKHWLEQSEITFHDSKVYDYFKENYPDLFKD